MYLMASGTHERNPSTRNDVSRRGDYLQRMGDGCRCGGVGKRDGALSMPIVEHKSQDEPTLLEVVLRVQGEFRQHLAPLHVTPLQAGVILYLHRQREATATETAVGVGVAGSTLSVAVRTLIRKRWVTNQRTLDDRRAVCLRLTQRGEVLAGRIKEHLLRYEADTEQGNLLRLGQQVAKGKSH